VSNKQLKRLCQKAVEVNRNKSKNIHKENGLPILLKKRAKVVVFQTNFAANVQSAKQLITRGNIFSPRRKSFQ
jgi:ribosomal protein S4